MVGGAGVCVWLKSRVCGCVADGQGSRLCGRWAGQPPVWLMGGAGPRCPNCVAAMCKHCVRWTQSHSPLPAHAMGLPLSRLTFVTCRVHRLQAGNLNDAGSALAMELLPGKPDACRELLWWLVRGLGELRCLWSGRWRVQSLAVLGCHTTSECPPPAAPRLSVPLSKAAHR